MNLLTKFKNLGPGLLYAGAAVGVSHLVQSTQAGAGFGFSLLWVILIANLIKYPFFEFGPRYAAASGESLIHGYRKIWGGMPLVIFILMTLGTMFIIQSAVTIVTGGLAAYMLTYAGLDTIVVGGFDAGVWLWGKTLGENQEMYIDPVKLSSRILVLCALILAIGKYKLLDQLMKLVILLLTLTTILALVMALAEKGIQSGPGFDWGNTELILAVIIPLVGWMPAPLDIAVWHSVWTIEKKKEQGGKLSVKSALSDFKIGYWGTTILAVFFLSLGALILFGSHEPIETKAGPFARQLIEMYTSTLGSWARPLIAIAAFTTMFSTTLTCLDAFTRVLQTSSSLFISPKGKIKKYNLHYWGWICTMVVGTSWLLFNQLQSMGQMVRLATSISFLTAPILATFSYVAVKSKYVPPQARPKTLLNAMAIMGLLFLYAFAGFYLYHQF